MLKMHFLEGHGGVIYLGPSSKPLFLYLKFKNSQKITIFH